MKNARRGEFRSLDLHPEEESTRRGQKKKKEGYLLVHREGRI